MTPEQQKRIISQETWDDQSFGQLDLSAFPDLNAPPPEDKHDGQFAKHWTDTPFSNSDLRRFIENPDTETLKRVADEIGHEQFVDEVRQRKGELVVQQFKRERPDYLPCSENTDRVTETMAFNFLPLNARDGDTDEIINRLIDANVWDLQHLCAVYDALEAEGLMVHPAGDPRPLTERERLRIARMAQAGRVDEAIGEYLRCALDGDEPSLDLVSDPKYRALCDDAVFAVFEETQLDFVPTGSRKAFLFRFAGNRPLTLPLLQQAWKACQQNERQHGRAALLNQIERKQQTPPTPAEIDELKDDEIETLYRESLRAYSETFRAPGILA
jgi:hypothetical protein